MYLLGYDIGSSSVKASLVDAQKGNCVATAFYPKSEAPIKAVRAGWAEQDPNAWWNTSRQLRLTSWLRAEQTKPT